MNSATAGDAIRQRAEPALDHFLLPLPFGDAAGLGLRAFGQVLQRGDDALQFAQVLGVGRQGLLQRIQPVRQNGPVGPRVERQERLVIPQEERPLAILQLQFARFEDLPILIAQDGQEDSVPQFLLDGMPIDVEVGGVRRGGAVLQHVVPPQVLGGRRAHVIGHGVQNLAHRAAVQGLDHRPIIVLAAQLGVQLRVIDDGIAVRASRAGLQVGRGVEVADAEFVQVRHDAGRIAERHFPRLELKAVGRRGMTTTARRPSARRIEQATRPKRRRRSWPPSAAVEDQQFVGEISARQVPSPFGRGLG